MRRFWIPVLLLLMTGFRDDPISTRTLDALKEATVMVLVVGEGNLVRSRGSGFLMKRDREAGYIATNHHVVQGGRGVVVVFHCGTDRQEVIPAEVVGVDPDLDFAILKVVNRTLPRPVELASSPQLEKGMPVHILGFPVLEGRAVETGFPTVTVTKGSVIRMMEDEFGCVPHVELDGELHPGNSGGPVIDKRGALVGISVAKLQGTKIGVAIPAPELQEMLLGRVRSIHLHRRTSRARRVTFNALAELIDPMDNLRTVSLLMIEADRLEGGPRPEEDGRWEKIHPAMKDVRLQVEGDRARGEVVLTHPREERVQYLMQVRYVRGNRKIYFSEPRMTEVDFSSGR